MNNEEIKKYKKEYENMSLCDLADEFVTPLFDVKDKEKLLKIIYINYAYERDKNYQLEANIDEALKRNEQVIKMIEDGRSKEQFVPYLKNQRKLLERGKE